MIDHDISGNSGSQLRWHPQPRPLARNELDEKERQLELKESMVGLDDLV